MDDRPSKFRFVRILLLAAVVGGGGYAWYRFASKPSREQLLEKQLAALQEEKARLEAQKKHLEEFVKRLSAERRVAEIFVTDQKKTGEQVESTSLMFIEFDRNGRPLLPRPIPPIKGNLIHVAALVVRFDEGFIEKDDPMRGKHVVLFYRIYGDQQAPSEGFRLDEPGKAPEFYRDASLSQDAQAFESELWKNFWRLVEDPAYRKEKGVSVAQGEALFRYFYLGSAYTVSMQGGGAFTIRERPLDPQSKQMLQANPQ